MPHEKQLLGLVEDDPVMGGSIVQRLELEGWTVAWCRSGREAIREFERRLTDLDLVVCDLRLPDLSGEEVFQQVCALPDAPPFLFITAYGEIDQAVRLMRSGAVDFMTKPFATDDFIRRIAAGRRQRPSPPSMTPRLGVSRAMRGVEDLLGRYADHDYPVLITGETGTGKEVAARLLHQISPRAGEPFVAVNCAAIPADLLESEIFGHEKGAFTGAVQRHLGFAERAGRGILFLDEIGDMPPALQAKMLHLTERRSFHRLGGETAVPFRARIVSASHRDLGAAGTFREDLYFRLAVLPVSLPPLRQRPDDIEWLLDRFLVEACGRTDRRMRGYSALTLEEAVEHAWPGNARELRNRVERAVALAMGEWIMPADLFPDRPGRSTPDTPFGSLADIREAAERRQIERALAQTGGQIARAARLLGVSRTTLWERMTRFELTGRERSET